MSFRGLPRRFPIYSALFALVASLAAVSAPLSSSAQTPSAKPMPSLSAQSSVAKTQTVAIRPQPIVAATPKKSMDWWVPGLLGASVMGAGVGMTIVMRRSQQQPITQPPEPITYQPEPRQQSAIDLKSSDLKSNDLKSSNPKSSPNATTPFNAQPTVTEPINPVVPATPAIPATPTSAPGAIATQTVRMAKPSVMDALVHGLRSKDPHQRQKAIWELGQRGDSRAVQPLVDLLLDSDSQQRGLVLSALSEISTRTLKPVSRALAISLQDENADVRKNAIRDLTRVYDLLTNVSQLLQSACEDPDEDVQETAKWALGQINRIKAPLIEPGPKRSVSRPETLN